MFSLSYSVAMKNLKEIAAIYHQPFLNLIREAQDVHIKHFTLGEVQVSSLISIKTGGCPEDCSYCPQAARYQTDIQKRGLMKVDEVKQEALKAKAQGASRVCLGAAWREVKEGKDFEQVLEMVRTISAEGLQVCCTLGMLNDQQAERLKEAGLYAYNHNIDTSEEFYGDVISTRKYSDRIRTIENVRKAGVTVCSGGILGLGEGLEDRLKMLQNLSAMNPHPESVPINTLVPVKGTPLENQQAVDIEELVRMIATARILMPKSFIRLSAGRLGRSLSEQALCFMAGANSIFSGEKLLTTPNPLEDVDERMFQSLGLIKMTPEEVHAAR
jgi:biotin synthase